jgi:hypothetical protein
MTTITIDEVRRLAKQLPQAEQLRLAEELTREFGQQQQPPRTPRDLRGTWAGKFPDDIDVEADIRDFRDAWKRKFDDL